MAYFPTNVLLFEMPGGGELIVILIVVLLLFGGKKIPELMRGLGRGVREFNDAKSTVTKELEEGMKENPPTTTTTTKPANTNATADTTTNVASSNNVTAHD